MARLHLNVPAWGHKNQFEKFEMHANPLLKCGWFKNRLFQFIIGFQLFERDSSRVFNWKPKWVNSMHSVYANAIAEQQIMCNVDDSSISPLQHIIFNSVVSRQWKTWMTYVKCAPHSICAMTVIQHTVYHNKSANTQTYFFVILNDSQTGKKTPLKFSIKFDF